MTSAHSSLPALDVRLRRLEYALTGSTNDVQLIPSQEGNIPNQIASLNDRLAKIATKNKSVKKLLQACTLHPT